MVGYSRFQSYFPILYYLGELLIILFATEIMLLLTYTSWTYLNTIFIIFWLLISMLSKSNVLGRGIKNSKLVKSTLYILFFFSGFVAIINMLFYNIQFHLLTIIMAVAIFYFLMLFQKLLLDFHKQSIGESNLHTEV